VTDAEETRVTNELTGGAKGSKPAQLFWTPPMALLELARVNGMGAEKYAPHNFRKGFNWSLSYNSLYRHILMSIEGEDIDPESGLLHMAHAAWHCLALVQFYFDKQAGKHPEALDDRWQAPLPTVAAPAGPDCCNGEPRTSTTCYTCGCREAGNASFTCARHIGS